MHGVSQGDQPGIRTALQPADRSRGDPAARADRARRIARRVGLTVQTVANIIRELEELDLVTGARAQPKGRGSPATSLTHQSRRAATPSASMSRRSGIEAALIDLAGTIVAVHERRIDADRSRRRPSLTSASMVAELSARARTSRMLGVGLAMPGPFDVESMSFVGPTTLEGWRGVPVAERAGRSLAALPPSSRPTARPRPWASACMAPGSAFRDFYLSLFRRRPRRLHGA